MEDKLRATLKELESSKNLCSQLLQERDDSEVEVKLIIDKNTELKNQLAELHIQHTDFLNQHQHLLQIVAGFQQCSDTHESALKRISELELELSEAHKSISLTESLKASVQATITHSLFNKLVGSPSEMVCVKPTVTIDLTGDDTLAKSPILYSHNKLKRYIKIKKSIRKYQKVIKQQNLYKSNISLRKERINLINQLKYCVNESLISKQMYDVNIQNLQEELLRRENTLTDIFNKYEASQQLLSVRMQEAAELVDLVRYNAERYESLTNNLSCSCVRSLPTPEPQYVAPSAVPVVTQPVGGVNTTQNHTVIFSDKLGLGLGSLLSNCLNHNIINHCYVDLNFNDIIKKIINTKIDEQNCVVLLIGNSLGINKRDLVNGINSLLKHNLKGKYILCALPYSNSLSEKENNYIFKLNNLMHHYTCRHSDHLLYFDTNNFVRDFVLTRETMFLSKKNRHLLATLLAYNIHAVIVLI